jgi:hypothetical protein
MKKACVILSFVALVLGFTAPIFAAGDKSAATSTTTDTSTDTSTNTATKKN